jgi:hypothetical protein
MEIDVGRLRGDIMDRREWYRVTRDASNVLDEAIKGGTPVIRGTRITVYYLLGLTEQDSRARRLSTISKAWELPRSNCCLSMHLSTTVICSRRA